MMRFKFQPSPSLRMKQSTSSIMKDLTLCLLAVTAFSVMYYSTNFGASYGLRVVFLMLDAVVTALVTEALYFKATKQDIKKGIKSSYGWITAMILVLITDISMSYYAITVATVIAIFFGKLVFGGFGQNIFNPAAFGEAIIMNYFAGAKSSDFVTGATPTVVAKSFGWVLTNDNMAAVAGKYSGLGSMFLGQYPSTMGSTCALLLIACLIFLVVRNDIDWKTPVVYIATVFVLALIIGGMHGCGLEYAIFNVLAGGVLFGGIFMVTDPVTTPVSLPGRIVYAISAASLTMIIRTKSNFSDGVLYAILLMNMLTPAIDTMMDGNQIKDAKRIAKKTWITSGIFFLIAVGVGAVLEEKNPTNIDLSPIKPVVSTSSDAPVIEMDDEYKTTVQEVSNDGTTAVYNTAADGFGLLQDMGDEYTRNEAIVTVNLNDMTIESIEITHFGDTEGIGTKATEDDYLETFKGTSLDDDVDTITGATFTSDSVKAMATSALEVASK